MANNTGFENIDFGGMSPEQMTAVGQLAQQVAGQQQRQQQLEQEAKANRINQKMEMLRLGTTRAMNEKKLKVEQQRADAYDRMVQAQQQQATTAAQQAEAEMAQLQKQEQFLENAGATTVKTNAGDMPLAEAMTIAEMGGKEAGFKITDEEWKKVATTTNKEGRTVLHMLQPSTGKTKDVETTAIEESEDVSEKIDDAVKTSSKLLGESQLAGLKSDVQLEAADSNVLSTVIGRENPDLASSTIGTKAFQANKQYYEAISKATQARDMDEVKKQVKTILKIRDNMLKRAYKAKVPPDTFAYSTYDIEALEQRLVDSGMDPKMVETVLGQASQELRSIQGGQ